MICPISYRQLLDHPASKGLFAEYAAECALPELGDIAPQADLYAAMEASGGMQCFGVFIEGALVGFMSILVYVLPHYGKKIATTESIFLARKHRSAITGLDMIHEAERYAKEKGCTAVLYTAPIGSRFSRLLFARRGYRHSNNVFVRGL